MAIPSSRAIRPYDGREHQCIRDTRMCFLGNQARQIDNDPKVYEIPQGILKSLIDLALKPVSDETIYLSSPPHSEIHCDATRLVSSSISHCLSLKSSKIDAIQLILEAISTRNNIKNVDLSGLLPWTPPSIKPRPPKWEHHRVTTSRTTDPLSGKGNDLGKRPIYVEVYGEIYKCHDPVYRTSGATGKAL